MFTRRNAIAMLLAGGQGSRLYTLTQNLAKPAVPFGGKYRIIDFPLSNCINSGIDTVGVLTQYQPLVLNEYIGNGQPWDLDRANGGVFVLPPYQKATGRDWYTRHGQRHLPEHQLHRPLRPGIRADPLGRPHLQDGLLRRCSRTTRRRTPTAPSRCIEVPMEEAAALRHHEHRRGRHRSSSSRRSRKQPKSNLASMGIYIFTWEKLRKYLDRGRGRPATPPRTSARTSSRRCWATGEKMFAYPFEGYWKDVGTIDSLWEANMDLLEPQCPARPLRRQLEDLFPQPGHAAALHRQRRGGAELDDHRGLRRSTGNVDFSILFAGVTVEEGAVVRDSIIMPGTVIKKGAVVEYAIVAENCVIGEGAVVGQRPGERRGQGQLGHRRCRQRRHNRRRRGGSAQSDDRQRRSGGAIRI